MIPQQHPSSTPSISTIREWMRATRDDATFWSNASDDDHARIAGIAHAFSHLPPDDRVEFAARPPLDASAIDRIDLPFLRFEHAYNEAVHAYARGASTEQVTVEVIGGNLRMLDLAAYPVANGVRDVGFENLLGSPGEIYLGAGVGRHDYRDIIDDLVCSVSLVWSRGEEFIGAVEQLSIHLSADYFRRLNDGSFDRYVGQSTDMLLWTELYSPLRARVEHLA